MTAEKTVSTPTGIALRQKLGTPQSGPPEYSMSPDLLLIGGADAFDQSVFTDPSTGWHWYFFQAPVIGEPNYLYIRGLNYNQSGAQTARVYLYYAQSDQLLDPTKWQSTGFFVGGVSQNYVDLKATTLWQIVLSTTPFQWTPPQPTTAGASYYLIACVDNSASPAPPVWPTQPFANLAALGAYIQANPNLVMLNTQYAGAFLRQFSGQTVAHEGTGAQTSPDIVVTGTTPVADVSSLTTQTSYSSGTLQQAVTIGQPNFVYLRALNTTGGATKARVYLFWATSGQLSATSFSSAGFTVAGIPQNWVDLTATSANQVLVSTVPIVWNPQPLPAGQTYVLIAYVDNSASPSEPDFSAFGYLNPAGTTQFIATHPALSWLGLTASSGTQPTASRVVPITTPAAAHSYYVGVQLQGIPTDGRISVCVPGPDGANTVVAESLTIPAPNVLLAWPVNYPASFATSLVFEYWQGATPPSGSFSITPKLITTG
jgi:hypothetical protein